MAETGVVQGEGELFDPAVPLDQPGSPFQTNAVQGLRLDLPPEVEVPPGNVLQTLLDFWSRNVQK